MGDHDLPCLRPVQSSSYRRISTIMLFSLLPQYVQEITIACAANSFINAILLMLFYLKKLSLPAAIVAAFLILSSCGLWEVWIKVHAWYSKWVHDRKGRKKKVYAVDDSFIMHMNNEVDREEPEEEVGVNASFAGDRFELALDDHYNGPQQGRDVGYGAADPLTSNFYFGPSNSIELAPLCDGDFFTSFEDASTVSDSQGQIAVYSSAVSPP